MVVAPRHVDAPPAAPRVCPRRASKMEEHASPPHSPAADAAAGEGSGSSNGATLDEVLALRRQVAALQEKLDAASGKIAMWERCMRAFIGCALLSPDMNDMYKDECASLLRYALDTVESIQEVHYVECSFPSVPSEARIHPLHHMFPIGCGGGSRGRSPARLAARTIARTRAPPTLADARDPPGHFRLAQALRVATQVEPVVVDAGRMRPDGRFTVVGRLDAVAR